jgi:DNA polymerase III epsilon subunit-like protein
MKALVFDTETTGLVDCSLMPLPKQPRIIEFCGLQVDREGAVLQELDFICNPGPGIKLDEVVTKITGLKDSDLVGKPLFRERLDDVLALIADSEMCIAHNLSYDKQLVEFEAQRAGAEVRWPAVMVCTVEETLHFKGFRLSLTALHEHLFGVGFPSAHRARHDVEALVRCVVELFKRGDL